MLVPLTRLLLREQAAHTVLIRTSQAFLLQFSVPVFGDPRALTLVSWRF